MLYINSTNNNRIHVLLTMYYQNIVIFTPIDSLQKYKISVINLQCINVNLQFFLELEDCI